MKGSLIGLMVPSSGKGKDAPASEPASDEDNEGESEKADAAADVLDAVKNDDAESLSKALERFYLSCHME